MPKHYHYAIFSQQVYKNNGGELPLKMRQAGWEIYKTDYNPQNFKFAAAAYLNRMTREVVVAFRGTIISLENLVTDIFLFSTNYPATYGSAKVFLMELEDKLNEEGILLRGTQNISQSHFATEEYFEISLTGHSLGSVFAELLACQYGFKAITFESPGSKHIIDADELCKNQLANGYSLKKNIKCYFSAPNAINTFKQHVGDLRRIYIQHVAEGISAKFALKSVIKSGIRVKNLLNPFTAIPVVAATTAEILDSAELKTSLRIASDIGKKTAAVANVVQMGANFYNGISDIKNLLTPGSQSTTTRIISSLPNKLPNAPAAAGEAPMQQLISMSNKIPHMKRVLSDDSMTNIKRFKNTEQLLTNVGSANRLALTKHVIQRGEQVSHLSQYLFVQSEQTFRSLFQTAISHQPVSDYQWLLNQHSIDNIVMLFDANSGKINRKTKIIQWPNLSEHRLDTVIDGLSCDSALFMRSNPSIPNLIFSTENNVIEAQIKRMPGYKVNDDAIDFSDEGESVSKLAQNDVYDKGREASTNDDRDNETFNNDANKKRSKQNDELLESEDKPSEEEQVKNKIGMKRRY